MARLDNLNKSPRLVRQLTDSTWLPFAKGMKDFNFLQGVPALIKVLAEGF
jgi:hypothetical protein